MIAHWHGYWFFPLFWIGWILIIAFLFAGRGFWRRRYHEHEHGTGSGEQVLAERYARGEITEQEYRERIHVLREHKR